MFHYRQLLVVQFTNDKRIVFLAYSLVLIVFLTHTASYSNIAVTGQQPISSKLNVRITYPPPLQQVPVGNSFTIFGTSTYNTTNDCTVYANSNDLKFQKVTAVGSSGNNNYSSWFFTYAKNSHPITNGINKVTAKISCKATPSNLTASYITNVTGIIVKNNLKAYNMNQQGNKGNSILESAIHPPVNINNNNNDINNTNNYGNALPTSNNGGKVSSSPFWFPNLFHNNMIDSNDNLTSNTMPSLQKYAKVIGITIKVAKNPISWGNEQTIKISVFDPNSHQPISNAIVTGSIVLPGLNKGITKDFTLSSNSFGTASYSWLIAEKNANAGVYKLVIRVSASSYTMTSALSRFTVMPVVLSNESNIQNKTNGNNLDKSTPGISTLHTGLALSR
jgi:hypothetical protein